jgi:hypothetical protein
MTFQIDHNLLHEVNNNISSTQWDQIIDAVITHARNANQPKDVLYLNKQRALNVTRQSIYDNYDRYNVPGLDFVTTDAQSSGRLTVYNGSEQARAPITFEQGMQIASNFLNDEGSMMAEEIVCEWVMDGNPSIF